MDLLSREPKFSPRTRGWGLAALSLVMSTLLWSAAIKQSPATQGGDGQYFHRIFEIVKVEVLRYHELPLWNPFECGGVPLWDSPEMPAASPLAFLTLPFPTTQTMWIWYIAHGAMAFASMWLLARREFALTRFAAFAASCLWALGVGHATQYGGGHATLIDFYLFPLALLFWRKAEESKDAAVGLGLLFAFMMFEGSAYAVVMTALFLAVEVLLRVFYGVTAARVKNAFVAAGIVSVVTLSVSAARLLPVVDQLRRFSRDLAPETDFVQWPTLLSMYFDRNHAWGVAGQHYVWPEYATYFGYVTIALVFVGLLAAGYEHVWLVVLGLLCFALMMGHYSPYSPWSLLHHVFPFNSMRVPSRFRLYFATWIALFVGLAIDRLPVRLRAFGAGPHAVMISRTVLVCFALFAAGDVFAVANATITEKWFGPPTNPVVRSTRLHLEGPGLAGFLDQPRQNRGRLACADSWPYVSGGPLWVGDVPQARSQDPNAVVEVANRTPNTFTIDVDVKAPARIQVNTPYEVGWRTDVGTTVNESKVLALDLPPGKHRVKVWYWPRGLTAGFILTALGLVASLAFLLRTWPFKRRDERAKADP